MINALTLLLMGLWSLPRLNPIYLIIFTPKFTEKKPLLDQYHFIVSTKLPHFCEMWLNHNGSESYCSA